MSKLFARSVRSGMESQAAPIEVADQSGAVAVIDPAPSVAEMPQAVRDAFGRLVGHVKVECALMLERHAIVVGWSTGDVEPTLAAIPDRIPVHELRFPRPDVATHFGHTATGRLGFALIAEIPDARVVQFRWTGGAEPASCEMVLDLDAVRDDSSLGEAMPAIAPYLAQAHAPHSRDWRAYVKRAQCTPATGAAGFLEAAAVFEGSDRAVVVGWAVAEPGVCIWIEDEAGNTHSLDQACWRSRPDVHKSVGGRFGGAALRSGFVRLLEVGTSGRYRLMALSQQGVHVLGEINATVIPGEPAAASRWLFGIATPEAGLQQRFDRVSYPLLSGLIDKAQQEWDVLPLQYRKYGIGPATSKASIVVPLYGRFDFVESQMVEWARDPWIREHAQLIYVLDDPALVDAFNGHADELFRLYRIPFEWVWGGVNRGFSGANNLGAGLATAPHLLFLNSDVFPREPGWLPALIDVLERRPDVGVVGPRLLFAEGGIQHAGMRFERLEQYGVWINRHPYLGLAPALDPVTELTVVPAVTGACMLVRREDFDAVDGWSTGYLIGDFEDSDLCLKLRERGLVSAYLPTVQLTHLERQSMRSLGSGDYRMRVTLWNALCHQQRWGRLIEELEAKP